MKSQILFYSAHKIHQMKKADSSKFHGIKIQYYTDYSLLCEWVFIQKDFVG